MSHTIFVDKKAFRKGVDDALTLRPIRSAFMMSVHAVAGLSVSPKSTISDCKRGSDERRNPPARKVG